MEYSKLGNTDIVVSKLCVGCMSALFLCIISIEHDI